MKVNGYIEMTLSEFLKCYPDASAFLPAEILKDKNYIVRINGKKIEFGYASDKWSIK